MTKKNQRKRVSIVTVRLREMELIKESSFLYQSKEKSRKIKSSYDAFLLVKDFFKGLDKEMFIAAHLNTKNEPIAVSKVSIGSLNSSIVHPREVMKELILSNASSFIIYHNHPSSNYDEPSIEDLEITKRLKKASDIIGINLQDHLIIYEDSYMSFKENGYVF